MRRGLLCILMTVLMTWLIVGTAFGYNQVYTTNGSMAVSISSNYQNVYKTWDSPNGYHIQRIRLTFQGRPRYSGATYTYDQVYVYYRTCSTCGYYTLGSYRSLDFDEWLDLSGRNAVGIRIRYYTNSSTSGATFVGDVPEIEVNEPPFTPGKPTLVNDSSLPSPQQKITWTANDNPAGTVYEVWRRTYASDGREIENELVYAGTSTSFVTTDLEEGRYYRFRVRASNGERFSNFSPETAVWTVAQPQVTKGERALTVSWPRVYPDVTYRVWYKATTSTSWIRYTDTTNTSVTIGNLSPGTIYNVAISPLLPEGGQDWWAGATGGNEFSPFWPAVSNFESTDHAPSSHRLWWNIRYSGVDSGATIRIRQDGVEIYQGRPSYSYRTINNTYGLWAYLDVNNLSIGTEYGYEVCAVNAQNECGPIQSLTYMPRPNVPTSFQLANSGSIPQHQSKLSWNTNGNPSGTTYELWRKSYDQNGQVIADERIYSGTATTFTTSDQTNGRYYKYRVQAVRNGTASGFSAELTYWVMPMRTVTPQNQQLLVQWPAIYPNLDYRVYYQQEGQNPAGGWRIYNGTSYSISLSPLFRYKVWLQPYSLPNGGVYWQVEDGKWYSPYWPQIQFLRFVSPGQTSVTLKWPRIDANARIQIKRNGQVIYSGVPSYSYERDPVSGSYYYMATWSDSGLTAGTTYTYEICALNGNGECGYPLTSSFTTLPPTPDRSKMELQVGSYGWSQTKSNGAWAEIAFETVQSATMYKLHISGPETRTITINNASTPGTRVTYRVTELQDGRSYTWELSAVNGTGESPRSNPITFISPNRTDTDGPSGAEILINGGAATTGATRVKITGSASDSGSGLAGMQFAHSEQGPWSESLPLYDFSRINLVTYAGANAFFTDLGGWETHDGVWATLRDEAGAAGGKVVEIRNDYDGSCCRGLRLVNYKLPVPAGEQQTVAIRYRIDGLSSGQAYVFSHWLGSDGKDIPGGYSAFVADFRLENSTAWNVVSDTRTVPDNAVYRNLWIGFTGGATPGAKIHVDWITINDGPVAIAPGNELPNPATGEGEWELEGSIGEKTVYARFVDLAGNVSTPVSAKIQFLPTDTTSPQVSLLINGSASGGVTSTSTVTLQITASDRESSPDMLRMRFRNDKGAWSNWEPYAPTKTWEICAGLTPALCEGERLVWVEVQDPAMNVGGAVAKIFFRLTTAPIRDSDVLRSISGTAGTFDTGSGVINVQYVRLGEATIVIDTAKLPGVKTVRFSFDQQRYGPPESVVGQKRIRLPMMEGLQTLYMQTDTGEIYELNFLVDLSPPEVQATWKGNATATGAGGRATLVIMAYDNLASEEDLMVSINGGEWIPWRPEIAVTLTGNGLTNVVVKVRDPAGHIVTRILPIFVIP